MENMERIIQKHNVKLLNKDKPKPEDRCNCRAINKDKCPLPGKCCTKAIVYQATLKHGNRKVEYVGMTSTQFKSRYNNHTKSFRNDRYKDNTALSQYIWNNNLNPTPDIKWKILKRCNTYCAGHTFCQLCTLEKTTILQNLKNPRNINKRTDIGNKCIHQRSCTLSKYPT